MKTFLVLLMLAVAGVAQAREPSEIMADPALEERARSLYQELRCLVCQNETIDSSNAPLAADLRAVVRKRLVAGDSDAEILTFLESRYGDFVRMTPPIRISTWALWFGAPLAMLLAIGVLGWLTLRRRSTPETTADAPLSAEETARADALLRAGQERS